MLAQLVVTLLISETPRMRDSGTSGMWDLFMCGARERWMTDDERVTNLCLGNPQYWVSSQDSTGSEYVVSLPVESCELTLYNFPLPACKAD